MKTTSHALWRYVAFPIFSLMLPVAVAAPPQSSKVVASTDRITPASRSSNASVCLDQVFYGPLPGKANYCLGLRDWNNGNYRQGLQLLKLAAGWGNKSAQYTLGLIYYGGHHVARNTALGIAWLQLADQRHNDAQIGLAAQSAVKWATAAQRRHGEALYHQMLATYGDKVATVRAWRHLQHWRRRHDARNVGCAYLVGQQAYVAMASGLAEQVLDRTNPKDVELRICMHLQTRNHVVRQTVEHYFQDWAGVVTVGPLKTVPAPATSSGH